MKRFFAIFLICCLCLAGCGEKSSRYMETANEHYAKGEYSEAAYNFSRAIEEDPDNEDAYYGLIDSYIMQGEYDKASKYVNKAMKRFDSDEARALQEELESLMEEEKEPTKEPEPTEEPKATAVPEPTEAPTPEPTKEPEITEMQKLAPEELYESCVDSIVWVQAGSGRGSGFFIEEDVVATNYHVVEGATALYIILEDETQAEVLQVLGYAPELDIALLKVDYKGEPLPFNTHGITVGEKTYAIGNPLGYTFTFSDGMVTNKEWPLKNAKAFLTNTPISSGNSGGPLLNEYGEVMGLTTATRADGQNLNFVVDVSQIALVDVSKPVSAGEFIRLESGESEFVYEDSRKSADPDTAQILEVGEVHLGELAEGDYLDYYKLEINESGTYYFCFACDDISAVQILIADEYADNVLYEFVTEEDGEAAEDYVYVEAGNYYVVAVELEEIIGQPVEYGFLYELSEVAYELEGDSADPETAQNVWLSQTLYGDMTGDEIENFYKVEIPEDGVYGIYVQSDDPTKVNMALYDADRQEWAYSFTPDEETGLGSGEMELLAGTYYFMTYTAEDAKISRSVGYAFMIFPTEEGSMDGDTGVEQSANVYGEVNGNTYVNEYLGIHFDFDSSWECSTAEELQKLPENVEDFSVGEDFYVFKAKRSDGLVQFDITCERVTEEDVERYQSLGEEAFADYMAEGFEYQKGLFEQQGAKLTEIKKERMEFCGSDKWAVKLTLEIEGFIYTQYQIYYMEQEYIADFVCTMAGENTAEEFFSLFW